MIAVKQKILGESLRKMYTEIWNNNDERIITLQTEIVLKMDTVVNSAI